MRHVKQRRTIDCGVAALATATGVSYETAMEVLEIIPAGNGDLLFALDHLTKRHWRIDCLVNPLPLKVCTLPDANPVVAVVQAASYIDEGPQHTHFICVAREGGQLNVFDPGHNSGPVEADGYRRGQTWLVSELLWCPTSISQKPGRHSSLSRNRYHDARTASPREYSLFETGQLFGQIVSIDLVYVVVENLQKKGVATVFLVPCGVAQATREQVKVFATSSNAFAAMKWAVALAREDNANELREVRVRQRREAHVS
jgi:hypothetical protein